MQFPSAKPVILETDAAYSAMHIASHGNFLYMSCLLALYVISRTLFLTKKCTLLIQGVFSLPYGVNVITAFLVEGFFWSRMDICDPVILR